MPTHRSALQPFGLIGLLATTVGLACSCDSEETRAASTSALGGHPAAGSSPTGSSAGTSSTAGTGGAGGAAGYGGAAGGGGVGGGGSQPWQATVVTFNTGTAEELDHDGDLSDGYGSAEAAITNQWYGNGLSWLPAIQATRVWFESVQPDVVVFQEIFHPEECASIPESFHPGYVCEQWSAGDPTVAQTVLGPGYQVVCNLGKPDKCAAVRTAFGTFQGCSEPLCLDGLDGAGVSGCGSGSRVGRGVVELAGGGVLTLAHIHGSSGVTLEDQLCRVAQIEQIFIDLDGSPGANGARNLVMGDFNTDPGRHTLFDLSARRWNDFVDGGEPFHFISNEGSNAPPTYAGLFNIDHVVSDAFSGSCWAAGVTAGHPDVYAPVLFDHKPIVCTITEP